jgi:antitoxin component of MazEF toxin-antitoxin module
MADLSAIAAAAGSLRTAGEIVKAMVNLKIGAEVQSKVIELQSVIMSAQGDALAAQSEQFTLLQTIRDLEAEMAHAKAWDAEKERYKLDECPTGVLVYTLKEEAAGGEPMHRICPNCYQEARKSILQVHIKHSGGEILKCHPCDKQFKLSNFPEREIRTSGSAYY